MRLVDEQQVIIGKEAIERIGSRTRLSTGQRTTVVFDAGAITDFLQHFDVVTSTRVEPLSLQHFAFALELLELLGELAFDLLNRACDAVLRHDKVLRRIDE